MRSSQGGTKSSKESKRNKPKAKKQHSSASVKLNIKGSGLNVSKSKQLKTPGIQAPPTPNIKDSKHHALSSTKSKKSPRLSKSTNHNKSNKSNKTRAAKTPKTPKNVAKKPQKSNKHTTTKAPKKPVKRERKVNGTKMSKKNRQPNKLTNGTLDTIKRNKSKVHKNNKNSKNIKENKGNKTVSNSAAAFLAQSFTSPTLSNSVLTPKNLNPDISSPKGNTANHGVHVPGNAKFEARKSFNESRYGNLIDINIKINNVDGNDIGDNDVNDGGTSKRIRKKYGTPTKIETKSRGKLVFISGHPRKRSSLPNISQSDLFKALNDSDIDDGTQFEDSTSDIDSDDSYSISDSEKKIDMDNDGHDHDRVSTKDAGGRSKKKKKNKNKHVTISINVVKEQSTSGTTSRARVRPRTQSVDVRKTKNKKKQRPQTARVRRKSDKIGKGKTGKKRRKSHKGVEKHNFSSVSDKQDIDMEEVEMEMGFSEQSPIMETDEKDNGRMKRQLSRNNSMPDIGKKNACMKKNMNKERKRASETPRSRRERNCAKNLRNKNFAFGGFELHIGRRYRLDDGRIGVCQFKGRTMFGKSSEDWIGLIIEYGKGKHNGTVKGRVYFKCREGKGIMVRPQRIVQDLGAKTKSVLTQAMIDDEQGKELIKQANEFKKEQKAKETKHLDIDIDRRKFLKRQTSKSLDLGRRIENEWEPPSYINDMDDHSVNLFEPKLHYSKTLLDKHKGVKAPRKQRVHEI